MRPVGPAAGTGCGGASNNDAAAAALGAPAVGAGVGGVTRIAGGAATAAGPRGADLLAADAGSRCSLVGMLSAAASCLWR